MANIQSAIKRARQNHKLRQHNAAQRSTLRTHVKNVLKAITAGDKKQAQTAFSSAERLLDRGANKRLIHKNKAARHKSHLLQRINQM